MKMFESFITQVNGYLYGSVLLVIFLAVSLYFTVKFRGVQFRQVLHAAKLLNSKNTDGGISGFVAYCVSTASRVGTGNMAGIVGAIVVGGPGAIFWMWIMAILGGSLAFAESTLAQLYKVKGKDGKFAGGSSYFIRTRLGKPIVATVFAVLMILTYTAFNGIQANTIANALLSYNVPLGISAALLAILTAFILLNPKREALTLVCSIVVPVMAVPYILIGFIIFIINIERVPEVFSSIITYAFTPNAITGAGIGTAISTGLKRGLFSNEAGMGGAPHAAAAAATSHPARQGLLQMFSVFTDTLIICSTTAFIFLLSPEAMKQMESLQGIALLQFAMVEHLGAFGGGFITLCVLLFAYSSVLGNFFYIKAGAGSINSKVKLEYVVVAMTLFMVIAGSLINMPLAWNLGDFFMGFMALMNIVVIFIMIKPAVIVLNDYEKQLKEGVKIPVYTVDRTPELKHEAVQCWSEEVNTKN